MTDEQNTMDDDFGDDPELAERLASLDEAEGEKRAEALRLGLEDYELEDDDEDILGGLDDDDGEYRPQPALPVLAVVGRPNVGKSALVNRILGRREAVVQDTPGVTRDRVSYKAHWNTTSFTLVDTGGWEPDAKGIAHSVALQAEVAIDLADAILFVVDSTVGATATDEHVVKLLRGTSRPVIVVANKVDDQRQESDASALWNLGLGEPWPVSALHGRGVADLLDHVLTVLPQESAHAKPEPGGPRRVALLGRPNVGKSSLLNKAAGSERVVVNELAGTTRDPVDELVDIAGQAWRFVDTAGIRRRVHMAQGADFYASLRTTAALEKAEVAVVLLDVSEPISEQDVRIIDLVLESGRALVLAFNKWDLLDDDRRRYLEREIEQDLAHVAWAPRVNISATTGRHIEKLVPALEAALESWDQRVPTGKFNAFLAELVAAHPHPVRGGKQPRILFGTQASTRPPTFVLFTSGFLDPQYRRFIQRRLREIYGFVGSPIVINMRVRERRGKKKVSVSMKPPPLPPDHLRDPGDAWVEGPDGTRYWGRFGAAGLLVLHPPRGVLLQLRAEWSHSGGTWGIPGGALKLGEAAVDAAFRESHEEAGVPKDQVRVLGTSVLDLGFWSYTTVLGVADHYFEPVVMDLESAALEWVPMNDVLGRDLHPSFGHAWPNLRDRLAAHHRAQGLPD